MLTMTQTASLSSVKGGDAPVERTQLRHANKYQDIGVQQATSSSQEEGNNPSPCHAFNRGECHE
eukprot:5028335-Amphidinium_carterae.1